MIVVKFKCYMAYVRELALFLVKKYMIHSNSNYFFRIFVRSLVEQW